MTVNEDFERACGMLRTCIDEKIQDESVREAVSMLLAAHEEAKSTIMMLSGQLTHVYEIMERITSRPEFKKMMEDSNG